MLWLIMKLNEHNYLFIFEVFHLVTWSIQLIYSEIFVYTPGSLGRAHPTPQETNPTNVARPFLTAVNGPPESP